MAEIVFKSLAQNAEPPWPLLLDADPSRERVAAYLSHGQGYLAYEGQTCWGVFVLLSTNPDSMELMNIAVAKSQRGKGYGKRLMQKAIDIARENGYKTLRVGTGNSSLDQLGFYQKFGFRVIGVEQDFFLKHYEDEIIENGIVCRDMLILELSL